MLAQTAQELRHELHRHPELSGQETETARRILGFFHPLKPDLTLTGLGGTGLAFGFGAAESSEGPTVMLRCELDALPIQEWNELPYRSTVDGVAHKCGHDGHMAILAAVALELAQRRPARGRVVLLFQPAEENGAGAEAVLADPQFEQIRPDFIFALHNLPGFPIGQILVKDGPFNCASRGMTVHFRGKTSHAAQPENGVSPALALSESIRQLGALPTTKSDQIAFVTVVGAKLGNKAFGTSPGDAEIYATLRTESDDAMDLLVREAEDLVRGLAKADGLEVDITYEDVFGATANDPKACDFVRRAAAGHQLREMNATFPWSEDFGRFTAQVPSDKVPGVQIPGDQVLGARIPGALFGLGAGEDMPALHHPDYDFPDELIDSGVQIFLRILDLCLQS